MIKLGHTLYIVLLCRFEQEYDEICTNKDMVGERESSTYQALNLSEMNYESMYMKVMATKK